MLISNKGICCINEWKRFYWKEIESVTESNLSSAVNRVLELLKIHACNKIIAFKYEISTLYPDIKQGALKKTSTRCNIQFVGPIQSVQQN